MHKKHTQLFKQFSATFQPTMIVSWEKLINAWKKDCSQPNPYLEPNPCKPTSSCHLHDVIVAAATKNPIQRP